MTANDIALATKKATAVRVIAHMASGITIKDACTLEGIKVETFNRYLARFPELQKQMDEEINAQMSETLTDMISAKKKNMEALLGYMATLRERMEMGLLDDKAAAMLMKADNHLTATMKAILPAQRQEEQAAPTDDSAKVRANEVLASMRGAKRVHVERTIETYRVELGASAEEETGSVIDAETSPLGGETTTSEEISSSGNLLDSGSES